MFVSELVQLLLQSLECFYRNDSLLAERGGMEQSCVFQIGFYFQSLIDKNPKFSKLTVDCEYNKNIEKTKINPATGNRVRPDLIVHTRDSSNNILVVEFKTKNNVKNCQNDFNKLKMFTKQGPGEFGYKLGVFLCLHDTFEMTLNEMMFFKDGAIISNDELKD